MQIRLFVAIDLPEQVKKELSDLSFGVPGAKWVAEDQLHLTLRFIGEVDGGVFRRVRDVLDTVKSPPFAMRLKEFGCFPPRKEPRVLWVGVDPKEEIIALRNRIETALIRDGLEPEGRKYSPHITVARLEAAPLSRLTKFLAGNNLYTSPEFPVTEFHLYSSLLTGKGAIHKQEAAYMLR